MRSAWSGRAVQDVRKHMSQYLPTTCARCGRGVVRGDRWVVGHIKSRVTHPHLTFEPSNWQIEHRECSDSTGQATVIEKAKRDALRSVGLDPDQLPSSSDFSRGRTASEPPPLPTPPLIAQFEPIDIQSRLTWDQAELSKFNWLQPLLDIPEDAACPLAMTRPHPEAVGSYGAGAIEWIEQTQKIELRWWQRLAITRQLEHRADGSLCWRVIVESGPRRIGKSVRLRGVALWRLAFGQDLFGEPQLVVHTGKDVSIVREIQLRAWRWAEDAAGWKVSRGRGSEALETPGGDRWLARAMHAVYGYDVGFGLVDEAWGVEPGAVDEGMEPATMERPSPQLHLTSTAHRRATSLMRRRVSDALAADDGETLLLLWAAAPGADPGDPETWRSASAHWSQDRERMIASKYEKALRGESDPEADDLDPMAGFTAQYLNQWSLRPQSSSPGAPVVSEPSWASLVTTPPLTVPEAVAVESWPGEVSVARAWKVQDAVVVSVDQVPDLSAAADLIKTWRASRPVIVGASLATDPAWTGMRTKPSSGAVRTSVIELARLLGEGVIRHDGGERLSTQVLALRTSPGADGLRMRSQGRADAIKAAVWAVQSVRTTQSLGKPRILLPSP